MLELIWGVKTEAFLDFWSIEHVLSGLSIGYAVHKRNNKVFRKKLKLDELDVHIHEFTSRYNDIIGVLFLAYLWEAIEHYLEVGLLGQEVMYWFQGVEFWGNRLITDPLALVLGYLIAQRFPKLIIPARAAIVAWLFVHIFVFPHSMYLHELF